MGKIVKELTCKKTVSASWVMCPVCRHGKILKLAQNTRAEGLVLFCRHCKHESVVEILAADNGGGGLPQVRLSAQA